MKHETIGKNIRACRLSKKLRQEDLAERTGLSTNYIGMLERGEKLPSLETFISILNALDASADVILCDVINRGYTVKNSMLNEQMSKMSDEDRQRIYDVVDALLKHSRLTNP